MESVENFEKSPSVLTAWNVIKDAALRPSATFETLPLDGPYTPCTVLALVLGMLVWCDQVMSLSGTAERLKSIPAFAEVLNSPAFHDQLRSLGLSGEISWMSVWLAGLPNVPLGLIFGVLAVHVCLVVCRAADGGLRGTWRVLAYTSVGAALALVPVVGSLIALVVVSIQLVAGLTRVHRTSTARVLIALALPVVVAGGLLILLAMWLVTRRF